MLESIGNIDKLTSAGIQSLSNAKKIDDTDKKALFEDFYKAAMGVVNETSNYQNQVEANQLAIATGQSDDLIGLMLSQEKAYSSLQFTVQATNKIVESFREIMRIQM